MVNKARFITWGLVVLAFLLAADACLGNAASQLEQAEQHVEKGEYQQAEGIYKAIISADPNADEAFTAQERLTVLYVSWGRDAEADAALDDLLANYSVRTDIARAVDQVADEYRQAARYQKARDLYQYMVEHWPQAAHAEHARASVSLCNASGLIHSGNEAAAEAAIASLIADFSGYENIAKMVYRVANAYRERGNYAKARQHNQYVLDRWPQSGPAIESQKGVVLSNIALGDESSARAGIERLTSVFSGHPKLPKILREVGQTYDQLGNCARAAECYRRLLQQYPDASQSREAQFDLQRLDVQLLIKSGQVAEAESARSSLMAEFLGNPNMHWALFCVANTYRETGNCEEAAQLYRYVAEQWPQGQLATESRMKKALSEALVLIENGDDAGVQTKIDELIAQFGSDPILPGVISMIAEGYYGQGKNLRSQGLTEQSEAFLRKAISTHTRVINQFSSSDEVPHACCWMGRYYRELGDYQNSIDMFQRVVDQYPDFVFVWEALYCVGINYESLLEEGLLDSSEAEAKIRAAYQQLLQRYPDCPRAEYARDWVSQHGAQ